MSVSARSQQRLGWASLGVLAMLAVKANGFLELPLPGCPLRALTGIPFPTCFLTRSVLATLRGDLGEAMELHLFGPAVLAALAWFGLNQGLRGSPLPGWVMQTKTLMFSGLLLLGYWLIRLMHWSFIAELPG